jgi:DNA repair photolyase
MDESWHHHPEKFAEGIDSNRLIENLIDLILATNEGKRGFPISICDYSDPFLKVHREHTLAIIDALIARGANNMVYITTKVHPGKKFLVELAQRFKEQNALRLTVFVSLPPIKREYEPVSIKQRVQLIKDLKALNLPVCWYLRPLVEDWYDEMLLEELCSELIPVLPDHIILSGLVMSKEIEHSLERAGLKAPSWKLENSGQKQPLSEEFETTVRSVIESMANKLGVNLGPIMGHRLCGTNGNHAYGCLVCGKNDRYCQLFQTHYFGSNKYADLNQQIKIKQVVDD